jgi:hypothetical protein
VLFVRSIDAGKCLRPLGAILTYSRQMAALWSDDAGVR